MNDVYCDNMLEIVVLENGGYVVIWSGWYEEYNGLIFVFLVENIWVRVYDVDG